MSSVLFVEKEGAWSGRGGSRKNVEKSRGEKLGFFLLKFLNVELIVCTGFETEKKK